MILGQERAFMPLYIAQSGDLDRCFRCLTHWLTHWQTLKDRATQYSVLSTQFSPFSLAMEGTATVNKHQSTNVYHLQEVKRKRNGRGKQGIKLLQSLRPSHLIFQFKSAKRDEQKLVLIEYIGYAWSLEYIVSIQTETIIFDRWATKE